MEVIGRRGLEGGPEWVPKGVRNRGSERGCGRGVLYGVPKGGSEGGLERGCLRGDPKSRYRKGSRRCDGKGGAEGDQKDFN